jgi:hypothetical protein
MLSFKTSEKLAVFLSSICVNESKIQAIREILNEVFKFELSNIFTILDPQQKGFITFSDI